MAIHDAQLSLSTHLQSMKPPWSALLLLKAGQRAESTVTVPAGGSVDVPLDELEAVGKRDLERNLDALKEACAKFAPGKSIAECMALVSAHKPKEADPVDAASRQLQMLRKFVEEKDLVRIRRYVSAWRRLSNSDGNS